MATSDSFASWSTSIVPHDTPESFIQDRGVIFDVFLDCFGGKEISLSFIEVLHQHGTDPLCEDCTGVIRLSSAVLYHVS